MSLRRDRDLCLGEVDDAVEAIGRLLTVVVLDLETGEEETYTLVFPENADISSGKISILAPVGTGMLGYEVGDTFEWDVPGGVRRLKVKQILP